MSIALEWCHKYSWELIFDEKFQYDPSHENDYDEEEVSTDCGAERGSTGLEHMVIDEVAKGSTTPAQDLGDMINSQIEHSPSSSQGEEVKETNEILERTSMEEKCRNIVTDMRNLQKNGDEEEEEESTECGAKSGSTGLEHMVIDKVAKGSTTPAQDLGNMINSQIEHSPSSSQGEEVKETDEILERTSIEEKCRNIVTDMRNLQKNDEEEESTERGAKSETGSEVAEGFTSVQDPVDINQQNESTSNQGEELVLRDQGGELNFPERTSIMEEKWRNIVKEVLPEETVVPLEEVPKEVMVQLLKVVDKLQVSLDRLKTNQDHSIWAPTWSELDALQPSSWKKMKSTTPFNNDRSSGSEDACNC